MLTDIAGVMSSWTFRNFCVTERFNIWTVRVGLRIGAARRTGKETRTEIKNSK